MKRKACWFFIFFVVLSLKGEASDDFQYWAQSSIRMIDSAKIDWTIFTDTRLINHAEDVGLYFVAQKIQYDFFENLSLGSNYTYLQNKVNNKTAGRSEFKFQHRLEIEINPHWNIGEWLKIHNRNRVEFRWIEDNGSYNTRLRHRWSVTFPFKNILPLKDFYVNSEFFYNVAENAYDENRTTPIGLSWRLSDKTALKTFYMIQSKKGSDSWSANQILGTQISLSF